jgi:hypothetical protein
MKIKSLIIALFLLHIGLAMFHINHTLMWDDEASVAWFAKNYNQFGKIIGFDGTHLFSYRNGQLINDQLAYNNPPLDIYYAAQVMRFFGDSDYTLRVSFALLGFIALVIFVWCLRIITGKDDVWFAYSSTLLILSVNYLLIEPNTRYYSLNFLFASISLLATLKIVKRPEMGLKVGYLLLQLLSLYFLFLSHYLAAVCWWLMCAFILWQQKKIKFSFKDRFTQIFVLSGAVLFALMVFYFISHETLNRPDLQGTDSLIVKYSKLTEWLFMDLSQMNIIPLWTVLVFLFLFVFRRHLLSLAFRQMVLFSLVFMGAMILLNPQRTSDTGSFDIRYLYVIMPILYAYIGYLLKLLHERVKKGRLISITLLLVFINSNLLSAVPSDSGVIWLLPNYVKERVEPYPTAYSEAISYINKHFKERKKILTLPGFHNTVFFRYIPEKIEVTNTLDEQTTTLSKSLIDSLGMDCLYIGHCKPDYVFQFGTSETLEKYPFKPSDFKYADTILIYANGLDVTRPELFWHSFGPKKIKDKNEEALFIFHD